MLADRFGSDIQHECEWELRELDAYMGTLLHRQGRADERAQPAAPRDPRQRARCAASRRSSETGRVAQGAVARARPRAGRGDARLYARHRGRPAQLRGVKPVELTRARPSKGPATSCRATTPGYDRPDASEGSTRGGDGLRDRVRTGRSDAAGAARRRCTTRWRMTGSGGLARSGSGYGGAPSAAERCAPRRPATEPTAPAARRRGGPATAPARRDAR